MENWQEIVYGRNVGSEVAVCKTTGSLSWADSETDATGCQCTAYTQVTDTCPCYCITMH